MDEIGSTLIILYERIGSSSWSHVKRYHFTDYSNMLAYNKNIHGSSVTYNGVTGRSYYADVYLWAGKNGDGDSRLKTTGVVFAT